METLTNSVLFTDNDLRVYAAVRRLKRTRVLELARDVQLAKSTVQGALSRLEQRGLVSRTSDGGIPIIRARSASNTLRALNAQKRRLAERHETQDKLLVRAIGALQRLQGNAPRRRKFNRRVRQ
ncbi:MAG: hypothetical protein BroJett014_11320 [Planctomycetota bacterium]|nr:hypothetical protein [Planctomycetota bacterium]GIK52159.1 MAG: hypothetical protein BroJett014_11320 [Planctomycetota bacterium]